MNDELKLAHCGCGGEAIVDQTDGYDEYNVYCPKCFMSSGTFNTEAEAVMAWNRAMSGNVQECAKDARCNERTAKVKEGWGLAMCCSCEKRVLPYDKYCSHCGAKLIWIDEEDIPIEYFENGGI